MPLMRSIAMMVHHIKRKKVYIRIGRYVLLTDLYTLITTLWHVRHERQGCGPHDSWYLEMAKKRGSHRNYPIRSAAVVRKRLLPPFNPTFGPFLRFCIWVVTSKGVKGLHWWMQNAAVICISGNVLGVCG